MLNKYPLWKTLMVLFIVAIGAIYALPNLYPEDPAVQISGLRGIETTAATLDTVKSHLDENKISFASIAMENGQILARFKDTEQQLRARDLLEDSMGDQHSVALNLTPATPQWLASIGGTPMKLGLDLSGGVSFLMEVNMQEAIVKVQKSLVDDFRTGLRTENIRYRSVKQVNDAINIHFRNADDLVNAESFLEKQNRDLLFASDESNLTLSVKMSEQKLKETREYALQQNITIIRNRVNELGVAEPLRQKAHCYRVTGCARYCKSKRNFKCNSNDRVSFS